MEYWSIFPTFLTLFNIVFETQMSFQINLSRKSLSAYMALKCQRMDAFVNIQMFQWFAFVLTFIPIADQKNNRITGPE